MTLALMSLTFQGEPRLVGSLDPEVLREAQREAFPRSPRRDALSDPNYRAYKCAPLRHGHWLLSVTRNPGVTDAHGRPALRAHACIVDRAAMVTPVRDPVAVWAALNESTEDLTEASFLASVRARSAWESDESCGRLSASLEKDAAFFSALSGALAAGQLIIGSAGDDVLEILRPALSLLPASKLLTLELATGSVEGEGRESCLVTAARVEVPEEHGRFLGGLLKRRPATATADLRGRKVSGAGEGPMELVRAIVDSQEWLGFSPRERFCVLMESLDKGVSVFDVSSKLQAMREMVRKTEKLSQGLEGWR